MSEKELKKEGVREIITGIVGEEESLSLREHLLIGLIEGLLDNIPEDKVLRSTYVEKDALPKI